MKLEQLNFLIKKHIDWVACKVSLEQQSSSGVQLILSDESIDDVNLSDLNLQVAEFHNVSMKNVSFQNSNLKGSAFVDCDLSGSNFDGCELSKSVFHNCKMNKVSIQNSRCYKIELDECPLDHATFFKSNFQYGSISDVTLVNVDFSGVDCNNLLFHNCKFRNCLGEMVLHAEKAILENCELEKNSNYFAVDELLAIGFSEENL